MTHGFRHVKTKISHDQCMGIGLVGDARGGHVHVPHGFDFFHQMHIGQPINFTVQFVHRFHHPNRGFVFKHVVNAHKFNKRNGAAIVLVRDRRVFDLRHVFDKGNDAFGQHGFQ
jgi:hypothetical protein